MTAATTTHVIRNAAGPDVAWRDGRLIDPSEARSGATASASNEIIEIDAGGATVLPGFIDPHQHPCIAALYGGSYPLVPPEVTDIPSLQRAVEGAAKASASSGGWVVVTEWNEELLRERRAPTRAELDEAAPDRPVFAMHYSCHRAVASSKALEAVGIDRDTPDPSGGIIERGKNGVPTGLLIERAMAPVEYAARSALVATDAEGFLDRLGRHHRALVAAGITHVVDAMVPEDLAVLYEEADRRGLLLVPTTIMPAAAKGGYLEAPWSALEGKPTGSIRGDTARSQLRVGPIKLVFDGAPVCAMCLDWWQLGASVIGLFALTIEQRSLDAYRAMMSVKPTFGRRIESGVLLYRPNEARKIVREIRARGFEVATHSIGNAATDLALDAYAALGAGALGHARLEHASLLSQEQIRRIADLGVAVVVQPHFVTLPTVAQAPSIPRLTYNPVRSLLDAKVIVSGSSDYPVASFDPLDAIRSAIHRKTRLGHVQHPDERIDLDDAVALYTSGAAKAAGCFDERGSLDPGKRADVIILDDALTVDSLDRIRVKRTFIGGRELGSEV